MEAFLDPLTPRELFLGLSLSAFALAWLLTRGRVRELEKLTLRQADDLRDVSQAGIGAASNAHSEALDAMKDMHDNALSQLRGAIAETIVECLKDADKEEGY